MYNLNGYNSLFTLSYKLYTIVIVTYWWLFENITFYNNRWIDLFYCLFDFVVEEVDEEVFFLQGFFDFVEDIFALGFNRVEMIAGGCV